MTTTQMTFTVESLRAAHATPAPSMFGPSAQYVERTNAPAPTPAFRAPTARQRELLAKLFGERADVAAAEQIKAEVNALLAAGTLDFDAVSQSITDLIAIPRAGQAPAAPKAVPVRGGAWTNVPDGRYAVESATGNNDLDFFLVTTDDEEGDWFGFRRVERVIGGNPEAPVKGQARRAALEAIVNSTYERPLMTFKGETYGGNGTFTGPAGAAMRYSDEIGQCCRCNRSLTRIESRQAGIGPVCAKAN